MVQRHGRTRHLRRLHARGEPFAGDPRYVLRRQVERAKKLGYIVNMGPELEFFLFRRADDGDDRAAAPRPGRLLRLLATSATSIRHDMVDALEAFGIRVEAAHHEVAAGQHEIDFEYADALQTADNAITFKFTLKAIAQQHGLYATFMPKPIHGINGSGMHTHQSLYSIAESRNAFADAESSYGLSPLAKSYAAGILAHARGHDRGPRAAREQLQAAGPGLRGADLPDLGPDEPLGAHPRADGLARQVDRGHARRGPLPRPVIEHVPRLRGDDRGRPRRRREGPRARRAGRGVAVRDGRAQIAAKSIKELPGTLGEALDELEKDDVIREALGDHVFSHFVDAKRAEWDEYRTQVSDWEVEQYLEAVLGSHPRAALPHHLRSGRVSRPFQIQAASHQPLHDDLGDLAHVLRRRGDSRREEVG